MVEDKRPIYIWIVVLLANIGVVLAIILLNNANFGLGQLIPLAVSLFLTIVPVLISRSKSELKNRFGYGIPILLLLPIPYFIYGYYTCTGKFCEIVPFIFGWIFGLSAVIFALFYAMGIYARKWNVKFVLSVILIEVILLVSSALYFGSNFLH